MPAHSSGSRRPKVGLGVIAIGDDVLGGIACRFVRSRRPALATLRSHSHWLDLPPQPQPALSASAALSPNRERSAPGVPKALQSVAWLTVGSGADAGGPTVVFAESPGTA